MSKKNTVTLPVSDEHLSRSVRYPVINEELSNLLGQVLTIIDASITEPNQLKAMKDLVKQRFGEKNHGLFWDLCYRKECDYLQDSYYRSNVIEGYAKYSEQVLADTPRTTPMNERR